MLSTCYIYRCAARQDMYIYLAEENDFDCIDKQLKNKLGELTYAMSIALNKNTKLAKENPETIIENLKNKKFHIQLPAETSIEELLSKTSQ